MKILLMLFLSLLLSQCTNKHEKAIVSHTDIEQKINAAAKITNPKQAIRQYIILLEEAKKAKNVNDVFNCEFQLGNLYYSEMRYSEAIKHWLSAYNKTDRLNKLNKQKAPGLQTNIGAYYMGVGYIKTAISYFLQARKTMDKLGVKDDSHWKNYINLGVAYMQLEQYDYAALQFEKVDKNFSPVITFLYFLNTAKLAALQNNASEFYTKIEKAATLLKQNYLYQNVFEEVQLEYYVKFNDKQRVLPILKLYLNGYTQKSLYTKLLLNKASLCVYGNLIEPIDKLNLYFNQVKQDADWYQTILFYEVQASYYKTKGDYEKYSTFLVKGHEVENKLRQVNNNLLLQDYELIAQQDEFKAENKLLKAENELASERLQTQKYMIYIFIVSILSAIGLSVLLYKNEKKARNLKEIELQIAKSSLEQTQIKQKELQKQLEFQDYKLKDVVKNSKKIAVLKKQIEAFLKDLENNILESNQRLEFKKAKVSIDAFFANYTDLAVIASATENSLIKIQNLQIYFPQLNEKEVQVLALIINNFTSKEIAILLSKSEKTIEYVRTQIRTKLEISTEIPLLAAVNKILNNQNANV